MLVGQNRRRAQHRYLSAAPRRLKSRPQSNFGFSEADVPANQTIHRPLRFHVIFDFPDRLQLILGFNVLERLLEFFLNLIVGRIRRPAGDFSFGVGFQKFSGEFFNIFLDPFLHFQPEFSAQAMNFRLGKTDVSVNFSQLIFRHVKTVRFFAFPRRRVFNDAIICSVLNGDSPINADAVVNVYDVVARQKIFKKLGFLF